MRDLEQLRADIEGDRLPQSSFVVDGYEAWLLADAMLSPSPSVVTAHPMHVFVAGILGMSTTMHDIWERMDSSAADGPMFGELTVTQCRSILAGEPLTVTGEFLSVTRKHGRSGTFDVLDFELTILDAAREPVGSVLNSWVFPRSANVLEGSEPM